MGLLTYIIDTFTSIRFTGNPTGVCYYTDELDHHTMLSLANELGFPVSAFIGKRPARINEYDINYFTPTTEIPACGHATLAAAKVVILEDQVSNPVFHTSKGIAISTVQEQEFIMMQYPKYALQPWTASTQMLQSLGLQGCISSGYCPELESVFIELGTPEELKAVQPNYSALVASHDEAKEVVITSPSDHECHDYLLRSFCPWIGIDEDPVTGSVHSVLAGFWKERLNKVVFNVFQASARGGELLVKVYDDKVSIGGKTIVVLKGQVEL